MPLIKGNLRLSFSLEGHEILLRLKIFMRKYKAEAILSSLSKVSTILSSAPSNLSNGKIFLAYTIDMNKILKPSDFLFQGNQFTSRTKAKNMLFMKV
jgi:hypothetical protein